jgi:3-hydroxyisobutyrate dehydrogenase
LLVHNRTKSKADELVEMGATYESIENIAKEADYLFLMLGFPKDVENMVIGEKDGAEGVLHHMKAGSYLIDHTTSSPELAKRIAEQAAKKGIFSIDAPVSGGDVGAVAGNLVVMIGGETKAVEHCVPIMDCYAGKCTLMGGPSSGQHTKCCNQIMVATTMVGLCESLVYGQASGI